MNKAWRSLKKYCSSRSVAFRASQLKNHIVSSIPYPPPPLNPPFHSAPSTFGSLRSLLIHCSLKLARSRCVRSAHFKKYPSVSASLPQRECYTNTEKGILSFPLRSNDMHFSWGVCSTMAQCSASLHTVRKREKEKGEVKVFGLAVCHWWPSPSARAGYASTRPPELLFIARVRAIIAIINFTSQCFQLFSRATPALVFQAPASGLSL